MIYRKGSVDASMKWYELLHRYWHLLGLHSLDGGLGEDEIAAFEARHEVRLSAEMRLYFQYVNGMSMRGGHDVDPNGFSFLPLAMVRTIDAFSSEMGWTIGDSVGHKTAFVFVDYLQWSCAYAFETACPNSGAVYLLGFKDPKIVATSLERFVQLYLSDDPLLYQP